jgi:hypothetical protein
MRKAWLSIGMIALTATACSHAPIQTAAAPSSGPVHGRTLASEPPTALYVIDGVVVNDRVLVAQPVAPSAPHAVPLLMIDGVPIDPPAP